MKFYLRYICHGMSYTCAMFSFIHANLRGPDSISCRKWDVLYFTTSKKKITNFYVEYAAIYSNNTLTNECWK